MIGHWRLYRRKWPSFSSSKKLQDAKKMFSNFKKNNVGGGESIYWKRDYQEVVRVGNQKWEIVEITIGIFFFCCCCCWRFVFIIFYTGTFQFPPEKTSPPPKVATPTQNPRPDLSLSYTKREGGMRIVMIVLSSLIWSSYSNLV